jgi:DNA-binding NarL/FixJ family response regulator
MDVDGGVVGDGRITPGGEIASAVLRIPGQTRLSRTALFHAPDRSKDQGTLVKMTPEMPTGLIDGNEVQVTRQVPLDLIVLADSSLDEAIDLTRAAKSLSGAPKVVVLLGQTSRDELMALLDAGVDATVLRSVTADVFAATVQQVLNDERVIGPALMQLIVNSGGQGAEGRTINLREGRGDLLTAKEREVIGHLAKGSSNHQIAEAMYVTQATVKTHLAHIYAKLKVGGRHEALSRAVALGLLG